MSHVGDGGRGWRSLAVCVCGVVTLPPGNIVHEVHCYNCASCDGKQLLICVCVDDVVAIPLSSTCQLQWHVVEVIVHMSCVI